MRTLSNIRELSALPTDLPGATPLQRSLHACHRLRCLVLLMELIPRAPVQNLVHGHIAQDLQKAPVIIDTPAPVSLIQAMGASLKPKDYAGLHLLCVPCCNFSRRCCRWLPLGKVHEQARGKDAFQ